MPSKHRGERLSAFLRNKGISYSQLSRELGVHRNTIDNWVKKEALAAENIEAVARIYPDIAEAFPEFDFKQLLSVNDPPESYTSIKDLSDDCKKAVEYYRTKCEVLNDKYDKVMEKYQILLEKQAGLT